MTESKTVIRSVGDKTNGTTTPIPPRASPMTRSVDTSAASNTQPPARAIDALIAALETNDIMVSEAARASIREAFRQDPTVFVSRHHAITRDDLAPQAATLMVFAPPLADLATELGSEVDSSRQRLTPTVAQGLMFVQRTTGEIGCCRFDRETQQGKTVFVLAPQLEDMHFELVPCPAISAATGPDRFERALGHPRVSHDILAALRRAWFEVLMQYLQPVVPRIEPAHKRAERAVARWVDTMIPSLADALQRLDEDASLAEQMRKIEHGEVSPPPRAIRLIDLNLVSMFNRYRRIADLPPYPPALTEPELYLASDRVIELLSRRGVDGSKGGLVSLSGR